MINDLDEAMLLDSEAELGHPGRVSHVTADLTDPSVPEKIVEATIAEFDSIDIIVNNAGYSWDNVIQKTTDEQFQAMLEIHLLTPFRVLRAASTYIRETAKKETANGQRVMRKVVNITSIAGTDGNPGQAGYSSGKAGIIGLTKTLAKEWGRYNVNVNAVGFGLIGTRLVQPLTDDTAQHGDARSPDSPGRSTQSFGFGENRMSAWPGGHSRRGRRRGAVLLQPAIGLCHRRSVDLRRRPSFLARPSPPRY